MSQETKTGYAKREQVSNYIQSGRNVTTEELSYNLHMPKHEVEFICKMFAQQEKITFDPLNETWSWKWQ